MLFAFILLTCLTACPDQLLVAHKEKGTRTCTIPIKAPEYEDKDTSITFDESNCKTAPDHWEVGP